MNYRNACKAELRRYFVCYVLESLRDKGRPPGSSKRTREPRHSWLSGACSGERF
jgi:hypothetical protein